jgi:hypothetical protein
MYDDESIRRKGTGREIASSLKEVSCQREFTPCQKDRDQVKA